MENKNMEQFKQKASEYFEHYFDFIQKKSARSVNELLGSAFRVNERLKRETRNTKKKDLYGSNDFLLIKMLRNLNEHHADVVGEFKMIDEFATKELKPDLGFSCLISAEVYTLAKNGKQVSLDDISKIDSAAAVVGDYVDIHPAIFNFSVHIYEELVNSGLSLDSKEFLEMKESYDKEALHGIAHYVMPCDHRATVLSDGSLLEEHIVPFSGGDQHVVGLPDYNLLVGLDKPLDIEAIDFDDIAKNFKRYIKCIDGKPKSYYESDFIRFDALHLSNAFSPIKHLLSYTPKKFEKTVFNVGSSFESVVGEEIRLKLLNYNLSAIFSFGSNKYLSRYDDTYDLLLYFSMIVNVHLLGNDYRETKVMSKIINSNSSMDVAKAVSGIRKNKTAMVRFHNLIFRQIVVLLIEFPFKDHQTKLNK